MKRFFLILLACLLCFGTAGAESPYCQDGQWNAEDIDLSGVQLEDGRLTGVVRLPETNRYGLPSAELRVDCELPADFTPEQRVTLHVAREAISKEALMAALGNVPEPVELYAYNAGMETLVSYAGEADLDNGYFRPLLSDAPVSAETEPAKAAVRELISHFGGTVAENHFHANPRDAAHSDPYSQTENSAAAEMSRKRRAHFEQLEAQNGRTDGGYTMIRGLYELYGLPVMDQFCYRLGEDWIGAASEFRAAVRDDGSICFAEIAGLPKVIRTEPLDLPDFDWQALLKQAIARLCATNAQPMDDVLSDGTVVYAGYSAITALRPCWVGLTADTLEPGWYCVTEQRVAKDDSLAATWALYGDWKTLMQP